MEKKEKIVEPKQVDKEGRTETYVKINETPENVARAIFSGVKKSNSKLREKRRKE